MLVKELSSFGSTIDFVVSLDDKFPGDINIVSIKILDEDYVTLKSEHNYSIKSIPMELRTVKSFLHKFCLNYFAICRNDLLNIEYSVDNNCFKLTYSDRTFNDTSEVEKYTINITFDKASSAKIDDICSIIDCYDGFRYYKDNPTIRQTPW